MKGKGKSCANEMKTIPAKLDRRVAPSIIPPAFSPDGE